MVSVPAQGEIWWAEAVDKRRPVLIVTRSEAVSVLGSVLVAPVTRTVRGIPTEIPLGPEHGLAEACVASLDKLQPIRRSFLTSHVGSLADSRRAICGAIAAMADC